MQLSRMQENIMIDKKIYKKDINRIESQEIDLIFNPISNCVQTRQEYKKSLNLINSKCAICDCDIELDKTRDDIENFVCEKCQKIHNSKNKIVDERILIARNRLYKSIKENLYKELEENVSIKS